LIIRKSNKLALLLLSAGIFIWLSFDWLGEYMDFTSNKQLREASFGVYLVLLISLFKLFFDFYLIYIKRAHVEITNKGILDKTNLTNECFYTWNEINKVIVLNGLLCEGLKITHKINIVSGDSYFTSSDAIIIKELSISNKQMSKLKLILKKYAQINSIKRST